MSVLIVVAHPDDEALIAGASIARWTAEGVDVTAAILSSSAQARSHRPDDDLLNEDIEAARTALGMRPPILGDFPNIAMNTVPHLHLVQFVERAMQKTRADVLVTHHAGDINDDHHQTSRACQAAARLYQRRGTGRLRALLYGEVLSSTDWALKSHNAPFEPTAFIEVDATHLSAKVTALNAYRDVMRAHPHPRSEESLEALALLRGAQAGMHRSEAFEIAHLDATDLI